MILTKCNEDCFNCPYDDCVKPKRDASYYRDYYKTHKEQIMEARRKYREKNREKINAYQRKWRNERKSKEQVNHN